MPEQKFDINQRMDWLKTQCEIYENGKAIYNIIAQNLQENPGTEAIVSPANLGDTVFIATLANTYKKVHGIKNLLILAKERQAEAVKWFEGVDGVVGFSDEEMVSLRIFFTISGDFYSNGIRYGHIPCYLDPAYPDCFMHIPPGFGGAPLIRIWEERILGLPANSPKGKLMVPEGMVLSENQERYKNAILIAPAAFTNKGIPVSFWEHLTIFLKEKGLDVYCNSGGLHYDMTINGTIPLVCNTTDLILNAPLFKHVISVRSGFTDLVSKTSAPLTVLHLHDSIGNSFSFEYGTIDDDVRDLGRMEKIYPVAYCEEREEELINLIYRNME